jgi:2,3-bisphosphoglycerate-independent phosphoglycerate mutase
MKKILYIVLDGLGDLPHPDLGGKTPLEAAQKPNLDLLAQKGQTGLVYTVARGIAPESDVAVISILGYDAQKYYTGRGPLESYAVGLEVPDGCLAYRVNFATVGEGGKILDRRVGRNLTTEEATALAKEVNEKVKLTNAKFIFKNTIGHRGVLVIYSSQGKLSGEVTNTDPAYGREGVFGIALEKFPPNVLKCQALAEAKDRQAAERAAKLTDEFMQKSQEILKSAATNLKREKEGKMPGNLILTRDGGDALPKFPSLKEKFGLRFGCFVEMPVEKGIALLTGMEVVKLPLPTKDVAKDYTERAKKVLAVSKDYDGLYIHLKGPDEPAHDGLAQKKKEVIEALDKFFFANLLPKLDLRDFIVCVTADHSTPCILKAHSADPVPFLVCGGEIKSEGSEEFSETACKKGKLRQMLGNEIMPLLVKLAH